MASWRDYARTESDTPDDRANSADSANSASSVALIGPIGANGTIGTALPNDAVVGLEHLSLMGVPKDADPLAWRLAMTDATALAAAGFVAQALDLGWSLLDLFGGHLNRSADPQADGLAVWLQGRRVIALTTDHAVAIDVKGARHFFNRPRAEGSKLLWDLGR